MVLTQKQSQKVVVNIGHVPRKRRRQTKNLRREAFQRITKQNLVEASRREGVSKALQSYGHKLPQHMPYETLDRAMHHTSHSILFDIPERQRQSEVKPFTTPEAMKGAVRPYLKSDNSPRRRQQRETTQAALAGIQRELGEQRLKVIRRRVGTRETQALQPATLQAKLSPRGRTRGESERLGLLRSPLKSYSSSSESDRPPASPGMPRGIPAQRLQQLQEKIQSIQGESRTERFRNLQQQLSVATQQRPRSSLRQSLESARANTSQ